MSYRQSATQHLDFTIYGILTTVSVIQQVHGITSCLTLTSFESCTRADCGNVADHQPAVYIRCKQMITNAAMELNLVPRERPTRLAVCEPSVRQRPTIITNPYYHNYNNYKHNVYKLPRVSSTRRRPVTPSYAEFADFRRIQDKFVCFGIARGRRLVRTLSFPITVSAGEQNYSQYFL